MTGQLAACLPPADGPMGAAIRNDEVPSEGRRLTTSPVARLEALLHTVGACSRLQSLRHSLEEGGKAA